MEDALALNDGRAIPRLGLGVWQIPPGDTAPLVARALATGYRLIDTAAAYGNEAEVGRGLRDSGLPRASVFVTTKLWNDTHGYDAALRAFEASLGRLGLDYVDLYLIHWPLPRLDRFIETWRALIRLRDEGRAHSIGVSNFRPHEIERLKAETGVLPVLNQIELHPRLQQADARSFHTERGVVTQSWTPLGRSGVLDQPAIRAIAAKHEATPAQVVLAWHLALGLSAIPRTSRPERLAENLAAREIRLDADDIQAIAGLEAGSRVGPDPETFG